MNSKNTKKLDKLIENADYNIPNDFEEYNGYSNYDTWLAVETFDTDLKDYFINIFNNERHDSYLGLKLQEFMNNRLEESLDNLTAREFVDNNYAELYINFKDINWSSIADLYYKASK